MRLHTPRVTGSFEVSSSVLTVNSSGTISGSATSTGSFGAIRAAGMTVPNLLDFSSSIASRITTEESDFTAAGISGSWQGVIGSGSLGMVSGSAISTGSFGHINATELGSDISTLISGSTSAAAVSGSWRGVIGSGSLGMVSGSAISTGSFGHVEVAGMTTPSILALSSSIETRLNTLSADIIALSIALG